MPPKKPHKQQPRAARMQPRKRPVFLARGPTYMGARFLPLPEDASPAATISHPTALPVLPVFHQLGTVSSSGYLSCQRGTNTTRRNGRKDQATLLRPPVTSNCLSRHP